MAPCLATAALSTLVAIAFAGPAVAATATLPTEASQTRLLRKEVVVKAPLAAVWRAWTSAEGLEFVSRKSNVELRIGGPYEWFLDLEADDNGRRGGEGSRILAFVPGQMLAFDWTFPPTIPTLRLSAAKTQAAVFFDDLGDGRVRVRFVQHGWQEGDDWDAGFAYFDEAWGYVLERLKSHLEADGQAEPTGDAG